MANRTDAQSRELIASSFKHVKVDTETGIEMEALRDGAQAFAWQIDQTCPPGPEKQLALRRLQECLFWANTAMALAKRE